MNAGVIQTIGNVLAIAACVSLMAFPALYARWSHGAWSGSMMGRHLMTHGIGMAIVAAYVIFNVFFDPPAIVRPVVWILVGSISWRELFVLYRASHTRRDHGMVSEGDPERDTTGRKRSEDEGLSGDTAR